jgi:hypothetical protein
MTDGRNIILGGIICAGLAIAYACLAISMTIMVWEDYREHKNKKAKK